MVYAIHVEQIERDVLAERHVAAVLMAAGAKKVDMPTMAEQRARFDAALAEVPKQTSSDEQALRRAMGLD